MTQGALERIAEHNDWANGVLLRACTSLGDAQLDATPRSPRERTIREVLVHLVEAQAGYASILVPGWTQGGAPGASLHDLARDAEESGRVLRSVADGSVDVDWEADLRTGDGYVVKAWTVFVQAINHGAEHRRQACSLLRALGVAPPRLDGWGFGEATGGVVREAP